MGSPPRPGRGWGRGGRRSRCSGWVRRSPSRALGSRPRLPAGRSPGPRGRGSGTAGNAGLEGCGTATAMSHPGFQGVLLRSLTPPSACSKVCILCDLLGREIQQWALGKRVCVLVFSWQVHVFIYLGTCSKINIYV